tara:strand:- start:932 stop:1144 length:213 start_codon:yes stop_codon:yes gene_type:complete
MEIVMDTAKIDELRKAQEQAQANLNSAIEAQRTDAVKEVKRLIKEFEIKEREVRTSFPKAKRKRKPKETT